MWLDLRDLRIDSLRGATLTKAQYLLMKLAEECSEVAQRCSKQMQFGKDEAQSEVSATNAERLLLEMLDLIAIWKLLQEMGEVRPITEETLRWAFAAKKLKMQKYLDKSFKLGILPAIRL
jgi:hypothetical protein